ncbi:ANTAR domain-containing protein [Streptomyces sp. NPDC059161]|uniref:ANTAR domain-containing protein n=1 Tax=Streptomyces sp. NPDC059161 TaxID=3346749 RepID=UPI00368B0A90
MSERSTTAQVADEGTATCTATASPPVDRPPSVVGIEVRPMGDRRLAVITGELDIHADELLYVGLCDALGRSCNGVDLDLSNVDFCDCSGLNVLLRVRHRALRDGKTLAVRAVSAAVGRLLAVTHTLPLLASPDGVSEIDPGGGPATGTVRLCIQEEAVPEDAELDLRSEVVQLRRAMRTRPVIDMARGLLMASFGLGPQDAWTVLVEASQHSNTKLHELAQYVVDSADGDPVPGPERQQLAAAVKRLKATQPSRPDPQE